MYDTMNYVILAALILKIVFPIAATVIICSDRPRGRKPAAEKATGTAQNHRRTAPAARSFVRDTDEIALQAKENAWLLQEQARLANEQATQAHMQAVQQHQQVVEQASRQQFDHFTWQSVTPMDQGGFIPTPTSMGMF